MLAYILCLLACAVGAVDSPGVPDLQLFDPYEAHSPDGTWSVFVDPSSDDGQGPATYRLSHDGRDVWIKQLPYTLRYVQVGDDGAFAGGASADDGGRLMLIGQDGNTRFEAALATESAVMGGGNSSFERDVVAVPAADRVLFRVLRRDGRGDSGEEWRVVRWSTGESIATTRPSLSFEGRNGNCQLTAVRSITSTPLLAFHWLDRAYERSPIQEHWGAHFVVTDLEARIVWQLHLPNDYDSSDAVHKATRLGGWVENGNALPIGSTPQRFDIVQVSSSERVTFEVTPDESAVEKWSVREVARVKFAFPLRHWERVVAAAKQPPTKLALERVNVISLGTDATPAEVCFSFDVDDRGRLGRALYFGATRHFVLCEATGATIADIELSEIQNEGWLQCAWVRGDRWLLLVGNHGWWMDLRQRTLTALPAFEATSIDRVEGTFDGGFAVLGGRSGDGGFELSVSSYDATGRMRWRQTAPFRTQENDARPDWHDTRYESGWRDLCASVDGEVGVLEQDGSLLTRFDSSGKVLGAVAIDQLTHAEDASFTDLGVDASGTWWIHRFEGEPTVVRVSRDGALLPGYTPVFDSGFVLRPHDGLRPMPDGRVWATDGFEFRRLNADGISQMSIGASSDDVVRGESERVFVDHLGRILVAERARRFVHAFDHSGKHVAVCKPTPDSVTGSTEVGCLTVSGDGNVHVALGRWDESRYSTFDSNGVRIGDSDEHDYVLYQPGTMKRWELGFDGIHLFDEKGETTKHIGRTPDNRWLGMLNESCVAADGSLAVVTRDAVNIWSSSGEPVQSLALPVRQDRVVGIALTDKLAFVLTHEELWTIDLATHTLRKAPLEADLIHDGFEGPFWRADARELWIVTESHRRVVRYRVAR